MRIDHPGPAPYKVEDYDFTFSSGVIMSFSVVPDCGDKVDFGTSTMAVTFHFAEKPLPSDSESRFPAEDITILMQHVMTISHRSRTVTPPTLEEQDLFKQALHQISKTVN